MNIADQLNQLKSQGFDFSQPLEVTICHMGETSEGYSLCDSEVPALPFKSYDIMIQRMEPDEDGSYDFIAEIDNIKDYKELLEIRALIESHFTNLYWETL